VARRIAHEIKNPLTPIQLSAERIRRKYRRIITGDLETFDRCTETIVRQVGDIGRMVDEFSAFARMPAPKFARQDRPSCCGRRCSPSAWRTRHRRGRSRDPPGRAISWRRPDGGPGP
jgi:nitrogen fixation/metabolism regulation signal transduction histidine kinase